jgi:hypothetical protein
VLEREGASLSDDERRAVAALASSHRSLFQVTAVEEGAVDLRDLIGGGRFSVRERRSTAGFRPADLVEARVFWSGSDVVFRQDLPVPSARGGAGHRRDHRHRPGRRR